MTTTKRSTKTIAHSNNSLFANIISTLPNLIGLREVQKSLISRYAKPKVMGDDGKLIDANKYITTQKQKYENNLSIVGDNNAAYGTYAGINSTYINQVNATLIDNFFMGYAELSMLTVNPILTKVCRIYANKLTSKWIKFASKSKKNQIERINIIEKELKRLNAQHQFNRAFYLAYIFGTVMMMPIFDKDPSELENPLLDLKCGLQISKGDKIRYLQIIEPTWYVPLQYNTYAPLEQDFYYPQIYTILGTIVHISRLFKIGVNEAPNLVKPMYLYNDIPFLQQMINYVMDFETVKNNITKIVQRCNINVIKTGAEALLQSNANLTDASASLINRLQLITELIDNFSILAIDQQSEDFITMHSSLANLSDIQKTKLEAISLVSGITPIELYGSAITSGLSANGEFEIKQFNATIADLQQKLLYPHLERLIHMIMLAEFGEIDDDIEFEFNSLDLPNDLQQSQISLNLATESANYVSQGTLTPTDVRERLAVSPDSGWNNLTINSPEFILQERLRLQNLARSSQPELTSSNEEKNAASQNKQISNK